MAAFGSMRQVANPNGHGVDLGAGDFAFSPDGTRLVTVGTGAWIDVATWFQTGRFNAGGASSVYWLPDGRVLTLGASLAEIDSATGERTPLGSVKFAFAPTCTLIRDGVLYGADGVWDSGKPDKPMLRGMALADGAKVCAAKSPSVLVMLEDAGSQGIFAAWSEPGKPMVGRCGLFDPRTGKVGWQGELPDLPSCGAAVGGLMWVAIDGDLVPVDPVSREVGAPIHVGEGVLTDVRAWGDRLVAVFELDERGELVMVDAARRQVEARLELTHPQVLPHPRRLRVGRDHALIQMHGLYAVDLVR